VAKPHMHIIETAKLGAEIRARFPIFSAADTAALAYLDSAASSQKPDVVINRVNHYLSHEHANIHRGAYALSARATDLYEDARTIIADFIGAAKSESIIFTKNATESINLVAHALERSFASGDRILLTELEHHSNIVPWQLLAGRAGLKIVFSRVLPNAVFDKANFLTLLQETRPRLVAFTAVSNAFGTVLPYKELIEAAHAVGARVLIDASQLVLHEKIEAAASGVDFLAFSGHKMYGPTGIGVLYVNPDRYEEMDPFLGGGGMISEVTVSGTTWANPPARYEAGTPPIAEAIGLGEAIRFIQSIGFDRMRDHEETLLQEGYELLKGEPGVTVIGPIVAGRAQQAILSFQLAGVHPHDLATILDREGVQIRAGHHCAMPAMEALGLQSTARASIGVYSTRSDFERLVAGIRTARAIFRRA
jgi:cysteine desulfurase/selenocysteine lyase